MTQQPGSGNLVEIGTLGQHLADADIGEPLGVWSFGSLGREPAVRFDYHGIESLQQIQGGLTAVIEGDTGLRGRG